MSNASRFESPITRVGQRVGKVGDFWTVTMELPVLRATDARVGQWAAFLAKIAGGRESVYLGAPYDAQVGACGAPLVNGGAQVGTQLIVDGVTPGLTIPAGTPFHYNTSTFRMLHTLGADATADGSGNVELEIYPAIRKSPPNNAALTFVNPSAEFVLASPDVDIYALDEAIWVNRSLSFVEDVRE